MFNNLKCNNKMENLKVGDVLTLKMNTISGVKNVKYEVVEVTEKKVKIKPFGAEKWTGSWIEV